VTSSKLKYWWFSAVVAPVICGWACSPSVGGAGNSGLGSNSGTGASGSSANAGGGPGSSYGGFGESTGVGGDFIVQQNGGGGKSTLPDGGCFATGSKAEQIVTTVEVPVTDTVTTQSPVDMFIMYDQSGSMNEKTPVGTKWDSIKAALTGFVNSPASAGIGMGIQYFPSAAPPCTVQSSTCLCIPFINICSSLGGGSCNAPDYATPDVPIEALPAVAPKIIASVGAHSPGGGTPTTPALTGALQYAQAWAKAHTDRKTVVVLATDGDPSGCNGNAVQDVANAAQAGFTATPSVETFVVGVGSSLTSLNAIAAAGGSGQALIVDAASGDPTQQFLDAMNKIRETITTTTTHTETHTETHSAPVPCEWQIPASPDGQKFDKTKVNVDFASGTNPAVRVGVVAGEADCANVVQGWHYDDAINPTKVLVCPQTCQTIQGTAEAQVSVVFGCATEPAVLR
jgi:hypothetical protein